MTSVATRSTPCSTCPYAVSTPGGVWAEEEYQKLPAYDRETFAQPTGLFLCHCGTRARPVICAGWVACHGEGLLALRLAAMRGDVPWGELPFGLGDVHGSGQAACDAGLAGIEAPTQEARAAIVKLGRRNK